MLRISGRMRVLHVTGRTLRGIRAGHRAVLLGNEPGTGARLRLNKATTGTEKNLSAYTSPLRVNTSYAVKIANEEKKNPCRIPRRAGSNRVLLVVCGCRAAMHGILRHLVWRHHWLLHYTFNYKTNDQTSIIQNSIRSVI